MRSAFGFGEALLAVPLLALVMPVDVAAPVAVLVSITVAAVALVQDREDMHARSAGRLFLATIPGIPLGLWGLTAIPSGSVKIALATVIILFSVWSLSRRQPRRVVSASSAWLFGLVAGVLGGAYGMNGPPLVVHGTLQRWTPRQFRATLQAYFLPASVLVLGGYAMAGLVTREVLDDYLMALPVVAAALVLGRQVNRRMHGPGFLVGVHAALIGTGLLLLGQVVF